MIIAIIMAILALSILLFLSATSHEIVEKKNQEIAKLERLRGNDACEISFMNWRDKLFRDSKIRVFEYLQKYDHKNLYCNIFGRDMALVVSIGYMVGYRYEVLPLGFIIDLKTCRVYDKTTGHRIDIPNR